MPSLIPVILGPTASGKTSVGIQLAQWLNGEIISVDSRKVYRGLPIGTATPEGTWDHGAYQVQGVAHHLMGHLSPDQPYTAGDFQKEADRMIHEIQSRGKRPILVGGTGFYFKALQRGLPDLPGRDNEFRQQLEKRMAALGPEAIHAELTSQDPQAAANISSQDRHKIIRALEVLHITGRPFSETKDAWTSQSQHRFLVLGIDFSKPLLDERIETRSRHMVEHGMLQETQALLNQGYSPKCPALDSFGYREAVQVIQGELDKNEFLPRLIKGTKAYAKRQRTWFRTQVKPAWFMCDQNSRKDEISVKMKAFIEKSQHEMI